MRRHLAQGAAATLALASLSGPALAGDSGEWNAFTIMPEDLARPGAPRFEDYPVTSSFGGRPAPVDLRSHREAKRWRTVLREGARSGPNFAGHLTVVTWGCGTECMCIAFVDARDGSVHFDDQLRSIVAVNVHRDIAGDAILQFRKDSALLVAVGCPDEDCEARRGVNYFVWNGRRLEHVFRAPRAWYPAR